MVASSYNQLMNAEVARMPDQVSTELQNEVVILNTKSGKYYILNPVGSFIWRIIEQPCSVRAITERILAEYNVERMRCEEDIVSLLRSLRQAGLIEMIEKPAAPASSLLESQA